jgi:hypothetical protein
MELSPITAKRDTISNLHPGLSFVVVGNQIEAMMRYAKLLNRERPVGDFRRIFLKSVDWQSPQRYLPFKKVSLPAAIDRSSIVLRRLFSLFFCCAEEGIERLGRPLAGNRRARI